MQILTIRVSSKCQVISHNRAMNRQKTNEDAQEDTVSVDHGYVTNDSVGQSCTNCACEGKAILCETEVEQTQQTAIFRNNIWKNQKETFYPVPIH